MLFTQLYIHVMWATKNFEPLLTTDLRSALLGRMRLVSNQEGIFIDTLNCMDDHVHVLIKLSPQQNIEAVIAILKYDSQKWLNESYPHKRCLQWQDDYIAISIQFNEINKVRFAILNQEDHHRKDSFVEECRQILEQGTFDRDTRILQPPQHKE